MGLITKPDLKRAISDATRGMWIDGPKFLDGADRDYWLPRPNQIRGMLSKAPIGHQGDKGEVFDCDDYSVILKARMSYVALKHQTTVSNRPIALGIVWGTCSWMPDPNHAANWILTEGRAFVLIEPQFNNSDAQNRGFDPIRPAGDQISNIQLMLF